MSDLTYDTPPEPTKPFAVGDTVIVADRCGNPMGEVKVVRATKRTIVTSCGRHWTPAGWWRGEDRPYPFPSIREIQKPTN